MAGLTLDCPGQDRVCLPPLLPGVSVHLAMDSLRPPRADADVKVFSSVEPSVIRPDVYSHLGNAVWCAQWDVITAADPARIALQDRAVKIVHAPFWVDPPDSVQVPKVFGVSTIMSTKRITEGHRLRHWIRERWPTGVPGTVFHGPHPASPGDLRQPYPPDRRMCFQRMFHLVIENSRDTSYFTEKLMDCFRCRSVPLYWGAPNISETFDVSGMILIGGMSGEQILEVMKSLTAADYDNRREAIERNFVTAEEVREGHNPFPLNPSQPPELCRRLGTAIREAQARVIERRLVNKTA